MNKPSQISVQLYSLQGVPDLAARIRLVEAAGLKYVETSSSDHVKAKELRHLLDSSGLTTPSGHFCIADFRERLEWVIDVAGMLGQKMVVLWGFPEAEHWPHAEGWKRAGAELGEIADRLHSAGVAFAFHNHDWELAQFDDGRIALDMLFDATKSSRLRFQPDLAWFSRGGKNPLTYLERYSHLIDSCHVKDLAPQGANADEEGWADLGQGRLPWPTYWEAARAAGASLMVLEHDAPNDPARFLRVSAEAARRLQQAELSN